MDRGNGNSREFGFRLSERDLLARWICLVFGYRIARSSRGFLISHSPSASHIHSLPMERGFSLGISVS